MINLDPTYLSEEHRQLREQLSRFIQREVRPQASTWEDAGILPRSLYAQMGKLGLLGLAIPVEHGGSAMDARATVVFGEELGRSSFGGLAAAITDHADMAAPVLVRTGTPEQQARFLPDFASGKRVLGFAVTEPGGGSDLTRMKTTARREGKQWILNGQKTFITNAISADAFITIAKTDPQAKGGNGFTVFIIEKGGAGFSTGKPFEKTGWASADMSELFFDNFAVPEENMIGEEGKGFYLLMQGLERERMSLCAQCVGMMERALELTLEHAKTRSAYGHTLWDLQTIRHELAAYAADLIAFKTLLYHAAAAKDRGESVRFETTAMKAQIPQLLKRMADGCAQIHGATGYMRGTEIERIFRDARPFSLGGGAASVMLDEVAKLLS